jgi:hypothetical protein
VRSRRRGRWAVLLLGMLALLCYPASRSLSASTYLVAERPDRFLIFNKYQQQITPRERAMLVPFVPMRIVRSNDVLGDGFTPCMTVEIGGEFFYIVKGREGELSGSEHAGAIRRFAAGTDLSDTIAVLKNGAFQLFSPVGGARRNIRRGERLVRFFQDGDRTYVGTVDQKPVYGFMQLPASSRGHTWETDRTGIADEGTEVPQRALEAIRATIEEVNGVYRNLYAFFNKETGEQRPIPRWTMSRSRGTIVCALANRPSGADRTLSTRYLLKDLENAVLGTPLKVTGSPDRIEIRMEHQE